MPLPSRRAASLALLLAVPAAGFVWQRVSAEPVAGLEVAEGLEARLFAEAPMLTNPTNLDVDARGRVWVVEGFNYRTAMHPENPVREEGDRIVILEDGDGDGRAETRKVFYQGRDIDAAMGIAVLGNRVIVSAYENVFAFTDTDGDDRADRKEVLYRFGPKNHDHTVHAFVFGPDGRLYFNVGNESDSVMDARGRVLVDRAGNRVTEQGKPYREGMVFRVEQDGTNFEVLGHNFRNPYEVALDSYGTLWQTDNDDDGNRATRVNFVMEFGNYGYQDEMTGAGWSAPRTGMEPEIPNRHWHQSDPGVVPNVMINGAGSPSGLTVYEGALLPEVFRGSMIHAEPGVNAVRAYPVTPAGAGYSGRVVDLVRGTRDPLFRPVDVAVAPDGSLFVADWYDPGVGGHDVGDQTQGRILRIAPRGMGYQAAAPDLATPAAAVDALSSPNPATRFLAHARLTELSRAAERALAARWRRAEPRQRARALWLLAQIPGRGTRYLDQALRDPDPDLRIAGLRAARRVGRDLIPIARRLVDDPSPQVRREVALALRHNVSPEAPALWTRLAAQHDGRDRWYLEALGIGADRQWDRFFAAWRGAVGEGWNTPAGRDLVWRARSSEALPLLAGLIRDPATAPSDRTRMMRALDFHAAPERQRVLLGLLEGQFPAQREITPLVLAQLDTSARALPRVREALDRTLAESRGTTRFLELVERYSLREHDAELVRLALEDPGQPVATQAARLALRRIGVAPFRQALDSGDPARVERTVALLGRTGTWQAEGLLEEVAMDRRRPLSVRTAALQLWGSSWSGQPKLLARVQENQLAPELRSAATQVLLNAFRTPVRTAAQKLFGDASGRTADGRALPPVRALAERRGDAARGAAVYARACAACHTARGTGTDFGPGLSEIGDKLARPALLTAILHPSAGISFGYEGVVVRLRDGSTTVGVVASETAGEVALRGAGGTITRIRESEIASRAALDRSLMPEGLASTMTEQELVDLVEYLTSLKRGA